ncbi:MAG: hypothetical protein ACF8MJ_04105 [Phycisphaerales bacterium JB050]
MPRRSDKALLDYFVSLCIEHELAQDAANSSRANKIFDQINAVTEEIRARQLRHKLEDYEFHPSPTVRKIAAFNIYRDNPELAASILKRVADYGGLVGFSAEMLSEEIKAGRVEPP